ncbi:MAG: tetratricopeptide repeat protein [Rhodocyclaceae bacterium]|nr:MAG: tetratricopeptide repeat protein [Rhodocyclaceae bacterium]
MPPTSLSVRHGLLNLAAAAFCALSCFAASAAAAPFQEAQQLLKQGQYPQALEQVEKHLSDKPKDPQGRFLRGVILTEMGKTNEAISVFTKLTEEFPELPEPYNNLAVIYAQQKQFDKAKQALEKAIRTHPSYATAHENLGDIYARLASQAYDKALQLDSSNATAQTKLAVIRDLISVSPRTGKPGQSGNVVVAAAPAPTVAPAPAPAVPVAPPAPVKVTEAPKPAPTPAAPPKAEPAATKPVEKPAAPATPATPAKAAESPNADINRTVEAWAADWSRKDVKAYLAHYAKDFKVPGGQSRNAWETERNQRIKKPGNIRVSVEGLKVVADGSDKAEVHFRQQYVSASLKSGSNKTLVMVKQGGKWFIQQERIGN